MKKVIIILLFMLQVVVSMAQENLLEFTNSLNLEIIKLEKKQKKVMKKIMKYAIKKKLGLASENVLKVPIYSIYVYKKYHDPFVITCEHWRNDSLFSVLNPSSMVLSSVMAYTDDSKSGYIQISGPYWHLPDPALSYKVRGNIPDIILKERPKFIFNLFDRDEWYVFFYDNNLTFWKLNDNREKYIRMTPIEFINSFKDQYYLSEYCDSEFVPPVYGY